MASTQRATVGVSGDKAENAFSGFIPLAVPRKGFSPHIPAPRLFVLFHPKMHTHPTKSSIPLNLPSHPSHEFIESFPDLLDFGQTDEVGGIPHGNSLQGRAVEAVGAIGGAHHAARHIHYRKFAIRQRKEQDAIAKIHRRRMVDARASPLVVKICRFRRTGLQK